MIGVACSAAAVQAFVEMAMRADRERMTQNRCIYESDAHTLGFYGKPGDSLMGIKVIEDPCPRCGRQAQTRTHSTCDGCGAPKVKQAIRVSNIYGWKTTRPGAPDSVCQLVGTTNTIPASALVAGTIEAGEIVAGGITARSITMK